MDRGITIIIDPIFRASRLDQTMEFVSFARRDDHDIVLITRNLSADDRRHVPDDVHVREVMSFPEGFWFGHLQRSQIRAVFAACRRIVEEWPDRSPRILISGLNELLSLTLITAFLGSGLEGVPAVAVHYDSNVVLLGRPTWRRLLSSIQKRLLVSLLLRSWRSIELFYPDERVLENRWTRRISYKPDPFIHPFRRAAPKTLPEPPDRPLRLLFIGRQDERKGIEQVRALAERYDGREYSLRIVGPGNRDVLPSDSGVSVRNAFVTNEELWDELNGADYVVLPYSVLFDSPSGVFVWAAVSGTPMIVSDRGFLSYMVRKYQLGYVFDDTETAGLATFLKNSRDVLLKRQHYSMVSQNCIEYSKRHLMDVLPGSVLHVESPSKSTE